ncbi:substrate-binding domain-containing protein [Streptomyces sp. TLI_053]|uniref:substrate-binding domain-containing protein n=1 Tax=Streptomyces sp. TLI_053 TaxID=1855352 RepID=UPI001E37C63B|nr:substrate-binding domain-containing protein [Streptomyces sp. TLI_053]
MARTAAMLLTLCLTAAALLLGQAVPAFAATTLNADGSSWAGPAIDQWRNDVNPMGIKINFSPSGSAAGRNQWALGQNDFTASDVPFRTQPDSGVGAGGHENGSGNIENPVYGYSYVPITAGGTAFMYNLTVAGKQVRDLRLSPKTIVEIFTRKITNWNDPRITADYGKALPSIPMIPIVRSDGSGATAQFTRWMQHTFQAEWEDYCRSINNVPCGDYTEFFPKTAQTKALNGSDVVANYIMGSAGEGTIGYDEYAFAKGSNWPVVKVLNPGGFFTLPTASNVAVALTAAKIRGVDDNTSPSDPNFLQQNLDGVYVNNDPRSYPVSSYSYLIVPRKDAALPPPPRFNDDKGSALSRFISYVLCAGQGKADELGYSPIPRNLVRGGILQTQHVPGNASTVDPNTLANCPNPTFTGEELTVLKNAPQPSPCDAKGAPLDCKVENGKPVTGGTTSGGSGTTGGAAAGGSGSGGAATGGAGAAGGAATGGSGSTGGATGGAATTSGAGGTGKATTTKTPGATGTGTTGGAATTGGAGSTGGTGGDAGTGGAAADPNAPAADDPNAAVDGTDDQAAEQVVDPQTGQVVARGRGSGTTTEVTADVVEVAGRPEDWTLSTLTALELLAVVVVPPLLGRRLLRRRSQTGGRS